MEILKNFGLDPFLFGAQVINFLIVLYLLKKFLYKPVLDLLKKREAEIRNGLKDAEEGRLLLEKSLEREKEILKKAREEAKKTISDAKNYSIAVSKQIEEDSKKQADKILRAAQIQIVQEGEEAEKRLAGKISSLSIEFLGKALSQIVSEKTQIEVMEEALKHLKRNETKIAS